MNHKKQFRAKIAKNAKVNHKEFKSSITPFKNSFNPLTNFLCDLCAFARVDCVQVFWEE